MNFKGIIYKTHLWGVIKF